MRHRPRYGVLLWRLALTAFIALALVEVGLRLFPAAIPLSLLVRFHGDVRAEIAQRRGLPTERRLVPIDRDDGGPPLGVYAPFARVATAVRDPEAVRFVPMDGSGFCNPTAAVAAGKIDVVILGDSFAWCTGVLPGQAWPAVVARSTGRTVYNLGRPGIGPYEYVQIFKRFGLSRSPRTVVLAFYEGNDLWDALRYHDHRDNGRRFSPAPERRPVGDSLLARHSYAFNLAAAAGERARLRLARQVRPRGRPDGGVNFRYSINVAGRAVAMNRHNGYLEEVVVARMLRADEIRLEMLEPALQSYVALARAHGFRPVVAYAPGAYTAYASTVVFADPALQDLMVWFSRRQRSYLQRSAQRLGYTFVDLTPALESAAGQSGGPLYFPINVHFTARGHAVVAEAVAGGLSR